MHIITTNPINTGAGAEGRGFKHIPWVASELDDQNSEVQSQCADGSSTTDCHGNRRLSQATNLEEVEDEDVLPQVRTLPMSGPGAVLISGLPAPTTTVNVTSAKAEGQRMGALGGLNTSSSSSHVYSRESNGITYTQHTSQSHHSNRFSPVAWSSQLSPSTSPQWSSSVQPNFFRQSSAMSTGASSPTFSATSVEGAWGVHAESPNAGQAASSWRFSSPLPNNELPMDARGRPQPIPRSSTGYASNYSSSRHSSFSPHSQNNRMRQTSQSSSPRSFSSSSRMSTPPPFYSSPHSLVFDHPDHIMMSSSSLRQASRENAIVDIYHPHDRAQHRQQSSSPVGSRHPSPYRDSDVEAGREAPKSPITELEATPISPKWGSGAWQDMSFRGTVSPRIPAPRVVQSSATKATTQTALVPAPPTASTRPNVIPAQYRSESLTTSMPRMHAPLTLTRPPPPQQQQQRTTDVHVVPITSAQNHQNASFTRLGV